MRAWVKEGKYLVLPTDERGGGLRVDRHGNVLPWREVTVGDNLGRRIGVEDVPHLPCDDSLLYLYRYFASEIGLTDIPSAERAWHKQFDTLVLLNLVEPTIENPPPLGGATTHRLTPDGIRRGSMLWRRNHAAENPTKEGNDAHVL